MTLRYWDCRSAETSGKAPPVTDLDNTPPISTRNFSILLKTHTPHYIYFHDVSKGRNVVKESSNVKVKLTLELATEAQRGSRGIALLLL